MIVVSTPKWDAASALVSKTLRRHGATAAVRTVERIRGMSPELRGELLERQSGVWIIKSRLHVAVYRGYRSAYGDPGSVENHGIVSRKVITDTGVAFLVDAWQNSTEMENMKYHGIGTGSTAEAASQTALVTESTTEAFNILLPLLGGVVTDNGGLLSHAAIVSREYGIPGVVGTREATQRITDGMRLRVDGDTGEVTVLG